MAAAGPKAMMYHFSAAVAPAGPRLDLHSDELLVAVQVKSGFCRLQLQQSRRKGTER